MALVLVILRSLVLSIANENPRYLLCLAKGYIWNLRNLKDTLKERYKVQRLRKRTDNEIVAHMIPHSIELVYTGKLIAHVGARLCARAKARIQSL